MTSTDTSESTRKRTKRSGGSVKVTKAWNPYSPAYNRGTIMQCPKHHVDYTLRFSTRKDPSILMYDCPEDGCYNSLQIATKS